VAFTAQNGQTEALLGQSAQQGLHLYAIVPCPGGFRACCPARQYAPLAELAQRDRVRLRVQKRRGLYFVLRGLMHRVGLWVGIACFVPLLLWFQNVIWYIDCGSLTVGQQTRILAVLRENGQIQPGRRVSEELLTAGEYALLESGEFSWASLNFSRGRLTVEVTAAKAVPEIAAGRMQGLYAKESGTVREVRLKSGTALVAQGQEVTAGQEVIGTARSERDGTLVFEPAAGAVRVQFAWQAHVDQPLSETLSLLTGEESCHRTLYFLGWSLPLPQLSDSTLWIGVSSFSEAEQADEALTQTRHIQPTLLSLPLPISVEEVTQYQREPQTVTYSRSQALALARLACLQELYAAYPDAECIARQETQEISENVLHYAVEYTVVADICDD
jgi:similar to stage IV sporulation protein